ncbi:MAG: tRNA pseudouridine(55) synthase TruB [Oscillospiraceae bacterium]|nr:tRNA pseudouridine(55) synthase TruB [Oscillospiraceae bacterium]
MNGILLIDKPEGWTSNDVVQKLRGILHERRIGHAGTLDPLATGLLVVFVGRATRCVEFAESQEKCYLAGLRTGLTTDTQDISGTVLAECSEQVTEERLLGVLNDFRGEISQIPPMYSAIKIRGQKLYDIARRGGDIPREPRKIFIRELSLTGRAGTDFRLLIRCSKGTYVRTICHDIGKKLGTGACMSSLRRLESGQFQIDDAWTLEQVCKGEFRLLAADSLFSALPSVQISEKAEMKVKNGSNPLCEAAPGKYRVYSRSGEFLAIGESSGETLHIIKRLYEV